MATAYICLRQGSIRDRVYLSIGVTSGIRTGLCRVAGPVSLGYRDEAIQDLGCGLRRISIPRTTVNKNAKGYYEPLHSTLSSTFCASGASSPNSLAGLTKPIVTVSPSTSSKTMTPALYPSPSKIGPPVLNLKRSTQFGLPTIEVHVGM